MRLNKLRSRAVFCLAAVVSTLFVSPSAPAQPSGQNILFVVIDDLRNWVGYSGEYPGQDIHGHSVHTPNIDQLASTSTRYLNAYTTMPVCLGSRTSVMFGVSPPTHGLTHAWLKSDPAYAAFYGNPSHVSIPEVLAAQGYHTAVAGKVFHSPEPARWNESGPPIDFAAFSNPYDPGPDNTFIVPEVLPAGETHPDQAVADWGVNFLNAYATSVAGIEGRPFFLALGFYQPHLPWRVPQSYYDLYPLSGLVAPAAIPGDLEDTPPAADALASAPLLYGTLPQYIAVEAAGKALDYTQAYLAAISHTDAVIGQVLDALSGTPYANNTSIVLLSDHGYHLREKVHWGKLTLWEQSLRVPLLVKSPGNPGYPQEDVTDAVSLLDIAATVVDLAGLSPPAQFEGVPLHGALGRSPVEIYLNDGKATINGNIKVIDYDTTVPGPADKEKYDLALDPAEEHNLIDNNQGPGC